MNCPWWMVVEGKQCAISSTRPFLKYSKGVGGLLPLLTLIPHHFRAHTSRQTQLQLNEEASLKTMHWNIPEDWESELWSLNAKCVICWKVDTLSASSWCVFHLFDPLYIFISVLQTEKTNLGISSAALSLLPFFFSCCFADTTQVH